jgi:hypothetical protein
MYPWVMVFVDLVGPFTIRASAKTHSLLALIMIDPASGWFEIVKATNKSATSIQDSFHNIWFSRYPRPQCIVIDNGNMGEFKCEFRQMCNIEQVQKVVNDMVRSFDLGKNHKNLEEQEGNPFDYFLQSTTWATCNIISQYCSQNHVNLCLAEI